MAFRGIVRFADLLLDEKARCEGTKRSNIWMPVLSNQGFAGDPERSSELIVDSKRGRRDCSASCDLIPRRANVSVHVTTRGDGEGLGCGSTNTRSLEVSEPNKVDVPAGGSTVDKCIKDAIAGAARQIDKAFAEASAKRK